MVKKLFFIFLLVSFCWLLNATIINIPLDYETIQAGIDASIDNDTVLVAPDIYYENLDLNGHNITLASLELTTGNADYIASTVIDGQNEESCIYIHNGETTSIQGFTMQNGYGTSISHNFDLYSGGGGVQINYQSTASITNCVITNNRASSGGGIYAARESTLYLAGLYLINNNGWAGGGLYVDDVDITFDPQNRCNIYNNNGGGGADIRIRNLGQVDVIVDTFTVLNPSHFFAECCGQCYEDPAWYTFDILHSWMELEQNDLFVATDGNDANRGNDPNFPLQTIAWATRKIAADSLHPHTIHVASGLYSHAANNQVFPIVGKDYLSIIGADMDNTIINNDWEFSAVKKYYLAGDFELSNFTIQSEPGIVTHSAVYFSNVGLVKLSNLKIQNNVTRGFGAIKHYAGERIEYENLIISNNEAVDGHRAGIGIAPVSGYLKNCVIKDNFLSVPDNEPELVMQLMADDDMLIENCIFTGHHSSENDGRIIRSTFSTSPGSNPHPTITYNNCLIADNSINSNYIFQNFNYTGLTEFNNCTIAGNGGHNSFYNTTISNMGDINVTNTIMYNNDMDYEIFMMADPYYGPWTLNVFHSLIKGGEENIPNLNGVNTINWRDGNLDADADPLFYGEGGDYPFYSLSPNSPCIDAGSNTVNLPECDLAGNRRVYGDGIDMGCYEWQGVSAEDYELPVSHNFQLANFPNPFTGETTISFSLNTENTEKAEIEIFNVKGQKVEILSNLQITNSPNQEIIWNANNFATGVYFYKLVVDGKPVDTKKMILLK
ncbi:MAG: T9SS type A sorting domain-containing protein [Candidatus Cloacimonetes bacterium]|nr:T9SS type A sorting domain-containing protein [Candidatus Cloacimonadota bacterium]